MFFFPSAVEGFFMYPNRFVVRPRNGLTLEVGIVCRISGCADQKEMSLDDQEDHCRQLIKEMYDGPVNLILSQP